MNDLIERLEGGVRNESRRKILRSALDCFELKGIESTSIDDIRQHSETSVGSIYHHFKSKEGIVSHLYLLALQDQSSQMKAALEKARSTEHGVKRLVSEYMAWVELNPREAKLLLRGRQLAVKGDSEGALGDENQARFRFLVAWIKSAIADGHLRKYPTVAYPSILIGQAENYCRSWLSGRVQEKPGKLAAALGQACWHSVRAD